MDGVVCSALEAKMIREACGDDFLMVTLVFALPLQQQTTKTGLLHQLVHYKMEHLALLSGRPITQAESPREAVRLIIEEMEKVSK